MANEHGSHVGGWDATAKHYDRMTRPLERHVLGPSRPWLFSRTHGKVLEIGVGTGTNLPHLPEGIDYTGTDVSPAMVEKARGRADELGLAVELEVVDASELPFADGTFDCVVSTYVFCCVPDEEKALAEALRVLKPGGSLLLANHVASHHRPIRWGQRMVDKVSVPRMGEHFSREPLARLRELGAQIVEVEHSLLGIIERVHARRRNDDVAREEPVQD